MSEAIRKLPGAQVDARGVNSPMNYELSCPECQRLLGLLGVFVERVATSEDARVWRPLGVSLPEGTLYRRAHCGYCHAMVFVVGNREVKWIVCPPFANACSVCGRPYKCDAKLTETSAAPKAS